MQIDITIEDPKAYTKPFTVRVNHQLMPDTELMEFVCQEQRRSSLPRQGRKEINVDAGANSYCAAL